MNAINATNGNLAFGKVVPNLIDGRRTIVFRNHFNFTQGVSQFQLDTLIDASVQVGFDSLGKIEELLKERSKTIGLFGKKKPALREASVDPIGAALSIQGLGCSQLSTGGLLTKVNGVPVYIVDQGTSGLNDRKCVHTRP